MTKILFYSRLNFISTRPEFRQPAADIKCTSNIDEFYRNEHVAEALERMRGHKRFEKHKQDLSLLNTFKIQ